MAAACLRPLRSPRLLANRTTASCCSTPPIWSLATDETNVPMPCTSLSGPTDSDRTTTVRPSVSFGDLRRGGRIPNPVRWRFFDRESESQVSLAEAQRGFERALVKSIAERRLAEQLPEEKEPAEAEQAVAVELAQRAQIGSCVALPIHLVFVLAIPGTCEGSLVEA